MTVTERGGPGRSALPRGTRLAVAAGAGAAVLTVAVATLPFVRFAYRAPELHVMLETANAIVAMLVAYLVYGRFRQRRRLQELLLVLALATVAIANLLLTALPDVLAPARGASLSHWGPLIIRLLGTVVLATAALTPARSGVGRRATRSVVLGLVLALLGLGAAWVTWGRHLPPVVDPFQGDDATGPSLRAHPVVLGVQAAGLLLYAVAAVAFTRQAVRTGDELLRWVGAGCVLASFARVHYLLFPSLYSEYVYTGDFLRLGFYGFMLVGASREITSFWQARAETAVLEDRRRIARDLHDGLVQELSYIHAQSRRLANNPGDPVAVERIGGAAGRAIDESRRALAVLTLPDDTRLPVALHHTLEDLASRYEVDVVVSLDPAAEGDPPIVEALQRITGEAVRNAVRHGAARRIDVTLTADPLCLTIRDHGTGFTVTEPATGRPGGFGLTSMRERAAGVGATLTVESTSGEGTTVRVSWL